MRGIASPRAVRRAALQLVSSRRAKEKAKSAGWLCSGAWAAGVVVLCLAAGCGSQYRPVVFPVTPTGPAPQPESTLTVLTSSGANSPGIANIFDGSGDTLVAQAQLGPGPLALSLGTAGTPAVVTNSDGTVNSFDPSNKLMSNAVHTSTLIPPAEPYNMLATSRNLFIALPNVSEVAVLDSGDPPHLLQQLRVSGSPVNFAGNNNAVRVYAISQDNGSGSVSFGDCENPSQVTTDGEVASIELSTLNISARLPVGICPVYGISSTDNLRTFILNRGDGTVTVINSQLNQLDDTPNRQNLNPATGALTLPPPAGFSGAFHAGPVYADYYAPTSTLVTANYDSNTISIINVGLDSFGNDGPQFGKTVTVPVGQGPDALTILRDGSRVYVANQKDSTVTVVNLNTYQVEKTIPVAGHPISIASVFSTPFGQVFVVSSDQRMMTVIRTDTDQVSASLQLEGTGVDVHASTQYAGVNPLFSSGLGLAAQNDGPLNDSHASGSGSPCGCGAPCYLNPNPPCS